ncbi:MAG: hypothetical protein V4493_05695 [Pseudomonadota bacterium]
MCTVGIHPALQKKPFMLERLQREFNLVRVEGKYIHLVNAFLRKPGITQAPKKAVAHFSPTNDGGNAA